MKIEDFNNHMNGLNLDNGMPKEISLLAIIEALLDGKPQKQNNGHLIVPPWLYEVKESSIEIQGGLGKLAALQIVDKTALTMLKEQKPYIKIIRTKEGTYEAEVPLQFEAMG